MILRNLILSSAFIGAVVGLSACASGPIGTPYNAYPVQPPRPGQGQYVRPAYLNPSPTPRLPRPDACQSQMFQGLVGQHEGAIYIAGLPGQKRVIKPASTEDFDDGFVAGIDPDPPFLEVRDFLPGQTLYAPSIRTVEDRIALGPADESRLTIELDEEGYVQALNCG